MAKYLLMTRASTSRTEADAPTDLELVRADIDAFERALRDAGFCEGLLRIERNILANYAMWHLGHLKKEASAD
jgi:hypothetical protein